MNDAVLPYLRCPNCSSPIEAVPAGAGPGTLRCARGHSFDIARQGYATLLAGRHPHPGDSAQMIADRAAFLGAGHFRFIAAALAEVAAVVYRTGLVVDAGTGTGYYLATVLDALPGAVGLGLDVARPALYRAARAHPRASAALADLWRPLPLTDGAAGLILDVFAPRNVPEFRRVLRPGGALLVVTPAADHLTELVGRYDLIRVDPDKARRVGDSVRARFAVESTRTLRRQMRLDAAEIRTLIGMTPSARHVSPAALPAAQRTVTAAVDLTVYRPA